MSNRAILIHANNLYRHFSLTLTLRCKREHTEFTGGVKMPVHVRHLWSCAAADHGFLVVKPQERNYSLKARLPVGFDYLYLNASQIPNQSEAWIWEVLTYFPIRLKDVAQSLHRCKAALLFACPYHRYPTKSDTLLSKLHFRICFIQILEKLCRHVEERAAFRNSNLEGLCQEDTGLT